MKQELHLKDDFGNHPADGEAAAAYRLSRIELYLGLCDQVVLDFTGIRNANSSFINALIAGVIENHGLHVLEKLVFKGCNPILRILVEGAIDLGLQKHSSRIGNSPSQTT